MADFPGGSGNDDPDQVHCPAFGQRIAYGLCWECCMADNGGPTDTAEQLRQWVARSGRFRSVADFQRVCAGCPHCAWRPPGSCDSRDGPADQIAALRYALLHLGRARFGQPPQHIHDHINELKSVAALETLLARSLTACRWDELLVE
jgi:hypothetical protein